MKYTFTEEQLNALIYEVMELASAGVSFEKWLAKDRHNVRLLIDEDNSWEEHEKPIWIDCETGETVEDAWYFYPIEGDPFDIGDLINIKETKFQKHYISNGIVLGNLWGGGVGSYEATNFSSNSYDDLIEQNEKALKSGNLDSGMGFESLIEALLTIEITEIVTLEGKEYNRKDYENIFIGELSQEQMDFLENN